MANILDEIVAAKKQELAKQKQAVSLATLQEQIASRDKPLNLSGALIGGEIRLIAEV